MNAVRSVIEKGLVSVMFVAAMACAGLAQTAVTAGNSVPPRGPHEVEKNSAQPLMRERGEAGTLIWSNFPVQEWWRNPPGYLVLDWGRLAPSPTGFPDEVVDGFSFAYATNSMDSGGESISVWFFDDCTGWGNLGVQEAGFVFTGLPNGYGKPPLPPGSAWIWSITVDLEGSGYEFLLNQSFGQLMDFGNPATGSTMPAFGSPDSQSSGLFDLYTRNGIYTGTWPSPNGAAMAKELFGPQAPADGMTYYGLGAQGNDSALYTTGAWATGQSVHFMLRKNGSTMPGWLLASNLPNSQYIPSLDITRLVGPFVGGTPILMGAIYAGDFEVLDVTIPTVAGTKRIYTQGAITALNPVSPADLSSGVYSN